MLTLDQLMPLIRAVEANAQTDFTDTSDKPVSDLIEFVAAYGRQQFADGGQTVRDNQFTPINLRMLDGVEISC